MITMTMTTISRIMKKLSVYTQLLRKSSDWKNWWSAWATFEYTPKK